MTITFLSQKKKKSMKLMSQKSQKVSRAKEIMHMF